MASSVDPHLIERLTGLISALPSEEHKQEAVEVLATLMKQDGSSLTSYLHPEIPDFLVWESDLEAHFTFVSGSARSLLGYPPDEWLHDPDLWSEKIVHPEDQRWVKQFCAKEAQARRARECTYRARRKDGSMLWIRDKAYVRLDPGGQAVGLFGFMMDVTENRMVEEAFKDIERRYRLATRATRDVVWELDLRTNELKWNEGISTVFSYSAKHMKTDLYFWYDNIHPDDRERVATGFHAAIDAGQRDWTSEYRYRTGEDAYIHVIDRGYVIRDEQGRAVRMVGAMTDISERKKAEQDRVRLLKEEEQLRIKAENALKAHEKLIGIISHDLKNPLTNILVGVSFVRMLVAQEPPGRDGPDRRLLKALARIQEGAERMRSLIDDEITLVRLESGGLNFAIEGVNLHELLLQAWEGQRRAFEGRNVGLDLKGVEIQGLTVEVDRERIRSAFSKLLLALSSLVLPGSIVVADCRRIGVEAQVHALVTLECELAEKISDPDHVFDRSPERMGLVVSQRIVAAHGGRAWTEKVGPARMMISFTLPCCRARKSRSSAA